MFESLSVLKTDRVGCAVHVITVSKGHLVGTSTWVDRWAVLLVRKIATIIITITFVFTWDASSSGAGDLFGGAGAGFLISSITTVVVTVTHVFNGEAVTSWALEVGCSVTGTSGLISAITAIVITVAFPFQGDTLTVRAGHLHLVT